MSGAASAALTFYFAPGSSSLAPHIALHEIGAPFESRPISFRAREQRSPDYLRLNPLGLVPTLLVDGRPLTEVAAILLYLARRFPEAGLLPAGGIEGEAQAVSWMSYVASTLHPAARPAFNPARFCDLPEGAARVAVMGREAADRTWEAADHKLGDAEWALGSYSIADIHLFRLFWRHCGRTNPPRERFPRLWAHHDRMMARPAVIRTFAIESAIGYEQPP